MSPSGIEDIEAEKRIVVAYAVHSSDGNVIGEVVECSCAHGVQPEHFVAYAFKQPDDPDGRYWLDTYEELDTAEESVADEYDRLGPFDEELEDREKEMECPRCGSDDVHFNSYGGVQGQHWRCDECDRFFLWLEEREEN